MPGHLSTETVRYGMGPTLVYDDDCEFCTRSATLLARHGPIRIVGFNAMDGALRDRLPAEYESCAHFVTDDAVYSCGAGVERALERTDLVPAAIFVGLRRLPGYDALREWSYRRVAENRSTLSRLVS